MNTHNKKIIIFDFDGTIIKTDSFILMINLLQEKSWLNKLILSILFQIYKKNMLSNFAFKYLVFWFSRIRLHHLNEIATSVAKKIQAEGLINQIIIKEMEIEIKNQSYIIIITASPSLLVKKILETLFPHIYPELHILGTELKIKNGVINGIIFNCFKKNKVKCLLKIGIKAADRLYFDSEDDIEIAKLVKEAYRVNMQGDVTRWK